MTTATGTQSDLFAWAQDLERENKRIAEINAVRVRNRGYLVFVVFATDASKDIDSAEYSTCTPPRRARPTRRSPKSGRWPRAAGCGRS